jgi:putative transposase
VETSWQNRERRGCHEEVQVFRKPDRQHLERSRSRSVARRSDPSAWIQQGSFYKWKAKYSGMSVSELKRLKELEEENRRLKQMYANLSLEHEALKDIIPYGKKL